MVKQGIYGVGKRDTIKPKRGEKAKTVMVKIHCTIDQGNGGETLDMYWDAVVNWKEGGMIKERYYSGMLGTLVMNITSQVKQVLIEKEGKIQEVDIIFKMPSGKDHQMTLTYKKAYSMTRKAIEH